MTPKILINSIKNSHFENTPRIFPCQLKRVYIGMKCYLQICLLVEQWTSLQLLPPCCCMVCCVILPVSVEALHYGRSIVDISTIKLTSEFRSIAWIWLSITSSKRQIALTHCNQTYQRIPEIHHIAHSLTLTTHQNFIQEFAFLPSIDLSNTSTNTQ